MRILYVEPFDGGSHATFTRTLTTGIDAHFSVLRLPGRHWKWRMRGSAAWAALEHGPTLHAPHDVLFCSSYVPLAELVGLAPALSAIPRVLYFHENQLAFPPRGDAHAERDDHFGFTQLVSSLAADACWFNSRHNLESFVEAGRERLSRLPDAVPPGWIERIVERSEVWPVPIDLPDVAPEIVEPDPRERAQGPVVLWNHRWEHDKNPDAFFDALASLAAADVPFRLAVCGRRFRRAPAVFEHARQRLADRIVHFGMLDDAAQVHALLARADVVVSTTHHEFFGISMVEATHLGARPLVPDRLAYPEIFGPEYRYRDDAELKAKLRELCEAYVAGATLRADRRSITRPYLARTVLPRYAARLRHLAGLSPG